MKGRDPLLLVAGLLVLWQLAYWAVGEVALRSPWQTFNALAQMVTNPRFLPHLTETLLAFAQGFVIAVAVGLAVGLSLGASRLAGEVAEPVLVAAYSIPKVTLYPIILLLFGIGMPAKVAFGAIHGIVPISLFAMNAVRNIPAIHLRTARVMHLPPLTVAGRILLPAALPEVFTGIRVGFSLTLIGTLLGEMFGAQRGLGFLLMQAMHLHRIESILALTLLLVLIAALANGLLLAIDRRLHARQQAA